jgi:hypothetical protein
MFKWRKILIINNREHMCVYVIEIYEKVYAEVYVFCSCFKVSCCLIKTNEKLLFLFLFFFNFSIEIFAKDIGIRNNFILTNFLTGNWQFQNKFDKMIDVLQFFFPSFYLWFSPSHLYPSLLSVCVYIYK